MVVYVYTEQRQGFAVNTTGIGERIIRLREEKAWSQSHLAKLVHLNKSVMNRIESEERPIRDYELDNIASVLDTSTDYLLGREVGEQTSTYYSPKMLQDVVDTLGISDLPFKYISKLNNINEADRKDVMHYIQYIIQRAAERESDQ